ncbi:isochorismate synthase [Saliterribacillus persicus]|uniref:Isochorismate synthase MenF n=1 Tax=Saliterribacillus persicus TaxID=930114 RepID=A0A368XG07_9BACI|nr:isochorismate synthase [Saliterribacillus persicus]RCW66922.1 isochorismate synthase [Saliterribacillus persicus]
MIETKEKHIDGVLKAARSQATRMHAPTFVSVTNEIDTVDPLGFFQAGKNIDGNRVFWSSATENKSFIGVGKAYTLKAKETSYASVRKQWEELLEHAIIDNAYPLTTPKAFGGFTFDEKMTSTNTDWKEFQGSQFLVPAYVLTMEDDHFYLTINCIVDTTTSLEILSKQISEDTKMLARANFIQEPLSTIENRYEEDPKDWMELVKQATRTIKTSTVDKIVLARELLLDFKNTVDITVVLHHLLQAQSNSYVFAFDSMESSFIGATPERLVRVENQSVLSACLAGTAKRGQTDFEDALIGDRLLHDDKNLHEHQFVVDMIREAISAVSTTMEIPDRPVLYPLKNLQHLYTPVKAELKSSYGILDVVEKLHPTPALAGYPREEAMQFIRSYESLDRGWYGAPIGWFDQDFNGEFAVAIRSALINDTKATLFAGCGVVKDSNSLKEYEETNIKFTPMLSALGG